MFVDSDIHKGKVKSWSIMNGYGFIKPTDGLHLIDSKNKERDVFVHFSAIKGHGIRNLFPGEEVKFSLYVSHDKNKFIAYYVEPLETWCE